MTIDRSEVARAVRGLILCDDPFCDPCTMDGGGVCTVNGEAADDLVKILGAAGYQITRAPEPDDEWTAAARTLVVA